MKLNSWQIERDENHTPIFIHAKKCPGYCDYACNKKGIVQAQRMRDALPKFSLGQEVWFRTGYNLDRLEPATILKINSSKGYLIQTSQFKIWATQAQIRLRNCPVCGGSEYDHKSNCTLNQKTQSEELK